MDVVTLSVALYSSLPLFLRQGWKAFTGKEYFARSSVASVEGGGVGEIAETM